MSEALDDTPRVYRVVSRIEKYADSEAFARGEAAEVVERISWYDEDGKLISDPKEIERLERMWQGGA